MQNKIAILGNGMLGTYCYQHLNKDDNTITLYSIEDVDILNQEQVSKVIADNDIIINCAAYTNVDMAENESDICYKINGHALQFIAEEINRMDKTLIHFSSDFVYGSCCDEDELDEEYIKLPCNVYGKSKLKGDSYIINSGLKKYLILRISWLFGNTGNNFVKHIIDFLNNPDKMELEVINNQWGRVTSTNLIVGVINEFLNKPFYGLYNLSCSGPLSSKYDIADYVAQYVNTNKKIIPTSRFNNTTGKVFAKRQTNSDMCCTKIDEKLSFRRYDWKKEVLDYVDDIT